jgi:hypothetical protein
MFDEPFVIVARFNFSALQGVRPEIEQFRRTQRFEWVQPNLETMRGLLHENGLILIIAKAGEIAIVGPIEEFVALVRPLASENIALVVAIEMNLEGPFASGVTLQELRPNARLSCRCH